jgi:UrcA family protein
MKPFMQKLPVAGAHRLAATFLAGALALATARAVATSEPSIKVRYDDLNLSVPSGVKTLELRIHQAAVQVCGPYEGPMLLERAEVYRECVRDAFDRAFAQIHWPHRDERAAQRESQRE